MSLSKRLINSSLLLVANQVILKALGLVSTLILARLLTPEDFGIVAIVAITLHFFDLISDVGSQQYLVQKTKVTSQDFNTAWSIEIIMKLLLAGILVASAPLISNFFSEQELTLALQIIALALPIQALKNPALAQFARNFNYKSLLYLQVTQKLISFLVVMVIVYFHTSYWALIIGDIVSAIVFTIGSYYIHSFRPKWSLHKLKEQWNFSQWLLLRSMLGFLRAQMDTLFVSRLYGSTQLGGYHMSRELALLPALNLITPALEPLLAAIAKSKNNAAALAYKIRFSLYCLLLLTSPISVYIWLFSYEIITVILGDQWIEYHQLLQYFALLFFAYPLSSLLSNGLIALGHVKRLFYFDLSTTTALTASLYFANEVNIESFALARCLIGIATNIACLSLMNRIVKYDWKRLLLLFCPVIFTAWLAGLITQYSITQFVTNQILQLGISTLVYFSTYCLLMAIWHRLLLFRSKEAEHISQLLIQQFMRPNMR